MFLLEALSCSSRAPPAGGAAPRLRRRRRRQPTRTGCRRRAAVPAALDAYPALPHGGAFGAACESPQ